jgi:hypothetical protein
MQQKVHALWHWSLTERRETLYHALIRAGQQDEILGEASLTELYSSTPPAN